MMVEKCTEQLPANDVVKIYEHMFEYEHDSDFLHYYKIDYSQFQFADSLLDLTEFQLKLIDRIMEVTKEIHEKLSSGAGEQNTEDL